MGRHRRAAHQSGPREQSWPAGQPGSSRRASSSLHQMDWQSGASFFTVPTPRVAKHMLYGDKIRTFKQIKNVYLYALKNISLYNKGSTFPSNTFLKSAYISISLLACGETRRHAWRRKERGGDQRAEEEHLRCVNIQAPQDGGQGIVKHVWSLNPCLLHDCKVGASGGRMTDEGSICQKTLVFCFFPTQGR